MTNTSSQIEILSRRWDPWVGRCRPSCFASSCTRRSSSLPRSTMSSSSSSQSHFPLVLLEKETQLERWWGLEGQTSPLQLNVNLNPELYITNLLEWCKVKGKEGERMQWKWPPLPPDLHLILSWCRQQPSMFIACSLLTKSKCRFMKMIHSNPKYILHSRFTPNIRWSIVQFHWYEITIFSCWPRKLSKKWS